MKAKILFLIFLLGMGVSLLAQTPTMGYIIEIDGKSVILDYTANDIKIGDRLHVYSEPKIIVHPVTKHPITKVGEIIATLEITETKSNYSVAGKVIPENAITKLKVGDKVILPEQMGAKELPQNKKINSDTTQMHEKDESIVPEKNVEIKGFPKDKKTNEGGMNQNNDDSVNSRNLFINQQVGYNYILDPGDYKFLSLTYKLRMGYFLSKNFAVIPFVGVAYTKMTTPSKTTSVHEPYLYYVNGKLTKGWKWVTSTNSEKSLSSTTILFGSGFRYYLGKVFLEPNFYMQKPEGGDIVFSIDGQIGYSKSISKKLAIELSAGYMTGLGENAGGSGMLEGNIGLSYYIK